MARSRFALGQVIDSFCGRGAVEPVWWRHEPTTAAGGRLEAVVLGIVFSLLAWLGAFEAISLAGAGPGMAAGLAVPGAFILLHLVPAAAMAVAQGIKSLWPGIRGDSEWWSQELVVWMGIVYAWISGIGWARGFLDGWLVIAALNVLCWLWIVARRRALRSEGHA